MKRLLPMLWDITLKMTQNSLNKRRLRIAINCCVVFISIIFLILSLYNEWKIAERRDNISRASKTLAEERERCDTLYGRSYCKLYILSKQSDLTEEELQKCMRESATHCKASYTKSSELYLQQQVDKLNKEGVHHRKLSKIFLTVALLFPAVFFGGVFVYKYLYSVYPF